MALAVMISIVDANRAVLLDPVGTRVVSPVTGTQVASVIYLLYSGAAGSFKGIIQRPWPWARSEKNCEFLFRGADEKLT